MPTHLPNKEQAVVDIRKLEDYCLDPSHPRGRHKARVFREALNLTRNDAIWLREALLEAARSTQAVPTGTDEWGVYWRIDAVIARQSWSAVVRSVWIIRTGDVSPTLISCWVL